MSEGPCVYASLPSKWAARLIIDEHHLNEIDYWCIFALHCNGDWVGVAKQIGYRSKARAMTVSKFTPGSHYHALGEKFERLDLAIEHLRSNGYAYNGLVEKHFYTEPR